METLAAMVRTLSEKLARLECGSGCAGDWLRLEAGVARAVIAARGVAGAGAIDCHVLGDLMDELRYIKLCAEARRL